MKYLKFNSLVLAMLVCMAGTFFASCGGDDDNNDDVTIGGGVGDNEGGDNQDDYAQLIVGDWTVDYDDDGPCKVEITFKSNGRYLAKDYYMQGDGTWSLYPFEYSGTYNVYGKTVNMVEKTDKAVFAGKLDIIDMTNQSFTLKSDEYNLTFRGKKTVSTTVSPLVGSWKCDYGGGNYQMITFNNDGTGSIEEYVMGLKDVEKIHYEFNESTMFLTIKYDEDGETQTFKVKSISSISIIINDGNEDLIYYIDAYGVKTNDNAVVKATNAEVSGVLKGAEGECEVGFVYGLNAELKLDECRSVNGISTGGNFKLTLDGLLDDEKYYYRAYAVIDGIKYWGEVNSFQTEPLTYIMDGVKYKMIKVEGGPLGDFSIMQTELLPGALLTFGDKQMPFTLKDLDKKDNKITKYEFKTYLAKLIELTGLYWRLPTSEEWKYAYQGGNKSKGYTYSGSNDINDVAWYGSNSGSHSHPAATKNSNELGIFDMSGNFAELTNNAQINDIKEHKHNYYSITDITGDAYGGNWKSLSSNCLKDSKIVSPGDGGTSSTLNIFDCTAITVRLIYDRCAKEKK